MTFAAKRLSREEDMRPVGQHLASPQVVEDALMLGNQITEITMAMEVNYFQLNSAEYFVPVAVKIPGRELALARRGGAQETVIDFIGEVKDDFGNTIQNLRDKLNIKLSESTASQLARPVGRFMIFYPSARSGDTSRIRQMTRTGLFAQLSMNALYSASAPRPK